MGILTSVDLGDYLGVNNFYNNVNRIIMINELIEKKICFAVIVSQSSFKLSHIDFGGKEYFIVISAHDVEKARSLTERDRVILNSLEKDEDKQRYIKQKNDSFVESLDSKDTFEYELEGSEEELFKSMQEEMFNKISHSEDGRIYELKSNSFVDYFHTLPPIKKVEVEIEK